MRTFLFTSLSVLLAGTAATLVHAGTTDRTANSQPAGGPVDPGGGTAGSGGYFGRVGPSGTAVPEDASFGNSRFQPTDPFGITGGVDIGLLGRNEPAIAVNPTNSMNIAYASLRQLRVSTDGGITFETPVDFTTPPTHAVAGDPVVIFDSQGRLFLVHLGVIGPGIDIFIVELDPTTGLDLDRDMDGVHNTDMDPAFEVDPDEYTNVTVSAGEPGGISGTPPTFKLHAHDKPWIVADCNVGSPFQDRLYIAWTDFAVDDPSTFGVKTSFSADHGLTWSPANLISVGSTDPMIDEGFTWPTHVAVGPNSDVYVAYHSQPIAGLTPDGTNDGVSGQMIFVRSTDGGATYPQKSKAYLPGTSDMTFNVQDTPSTIPGFRSWMQGTVQPWILPDPLVPGRVLVVANDDPDNDPTTAGNDPSLGGDAADVYIAESLDHGMTWGAPVRIDTGAQGTFQVLPTAAIDKQTGWISVIFYDNRSNVLNDAGTPEPEDDYFLLDVVQMISTDGGLTFTPEEVISDTMFDPVIAAPIRFNGPPPTLRMGEYIGVVVTDCGVHSVWCGNTVGGMPAAPNGQQSIYESRVPDEFTAVPPFLTCPANITLQCDESSAPAAAGQAVAFDACDSLEPLLMTSDSMMPGDCEEEQTITRTWTALDADGNASMCDQTITIIDTTDPMITCPPNTTITCEESISPGTTGMATGSDNCDPLVSITSTDQFTLGDCPQEQTVTRTWTATDNCGNTDACMQTIMVVDNEPPMITCPANAMVQCNTPTDPGTLGMATAMDDCDTTLLITSTDQNNLTGCDGTGTIQRTWRAVDSCNNAATCVQTITVVDTTDPMITCPANATRECGQSTAPPATGTATATDNCDLTPTISFTEPNGGPGDCPGEFGFNRRWRAVDDCGNDATCDQSINVEDTTPPTITCPQNRTVECGQSTAPAATGTATASDVCDSAPTVSHSDSMSDLCGNTGVITRTWSAVDDCNNMNSCVQTITVVDTTDPTLICPPDVVVTCDGMNGVPVDDVPLSASANDTCSGPVQITDNRPAGFYPPTCSLDGGTNVTFNAIDACGNLRSCTTTVTVIGDPCCPGRVELDTDVTLLPMRINLKQDGPGPVRTKAIFDIWNSNEVRFSGTEFCFSCWDQTLVSLYQGENHFLLDTLQTDKGKARIDAEQSTVCPGSATVPLLGVSIRELHLDGDPFATMRTAVPLVGTGDENGRIQYDIINPPDEANSPPAPAGAPQGFAAQDLLAPSIENGDGGGTTLGQPVEERASISEKGSLLVWPKVQLRWDSQGRLIEDSILTIVNDNIGEVKVQLYFVNGDEPLPPVIQQGQLIERAHPGWNWVDVQITLTADESAYWSVASGQPKGVSPFTVLDFGNPPGRPDLDPLNPGGRILRGFVVGWAINDDGHEIRWNHLTGAGMLLSFSSSNAAEYNAYAFRCVSNVAEGAETDGDPGDLKLNGHEYANVPEKLILDFFAAGSEALSHPTLRN